MKVNGDIKLTSHLVFVCHPIRDVAPQSPVESRTALIASSRSPAKTTISKVATSRGGSRSDHDRLTHRAHEARVLATSPEAYRRLFHILLWPSSQGLWWYQNSPASAHQVCQRMVMSLFHQLPVDHCHSAATQQSSGLLVIVGNSVPIWYLFNPVYFLFVLLKI